MVVGALIFLLGIELMQEALVDTWGKLHRLEYLTVIPDDPYSVKSQELTEVRW